MPTTIKLRNSVTTTSAPSSLVQGEVAINITDKKVWVGNAATTPIQLLGDGGSGSFTSIAFGAGTVSSPSITFTGDTNTGIYSPAADTIAFTEGGVESMRIDSSGNVGIGTSSPGSKLQINDSTAARIDLVNTNGTTGRASAVNGTFFVGTTTSHPTAFITGDTERMRIDSSGNVGIGTSSPATRLNVFSSTTNTARIRVTGTGSTNGNFRGYEFGSSGGFSGGIFQDEGTSALSFWSTSSGESMRITSGGDLCVGTTSAINSGKVNIQTPGTAIPGLSIYSPSTTNGAQLYLSDNNYSASIYTIPSGVSTSLGFTVAGSERMRIDSSGNLLVGTNSNPADANTFIGIVYTPGVNYGITIKAANTSGGTAVNFRNPAGGQVGSIGTGNTSTTYATSSDYRLKENIAPMTGALEKVSQLKPVTYNWKADGSAGQGFIAHELQAVVPDCVTGKKDAVETYTDEEGNKQTRPVYQGVDTSFLVATLTAAIQEQQAMIEELKQEVAALKTK